MMLWSLLVVFFYFLFLGHNIQNNIVLLRGLVKFCSQSHTVVPTWSWYILGLSDSRATARKT